MTNAQKDAQWGHILKHGRKLLALYPEAIEKEPAALCRVLRRWERIAHDIALRLTNGPPFQGGYAEVDARCAVILRKVRQILGPGPRIHINRDGRGYALKIDSDQALDLHRDMGGYYIIAPEIGPEG